MYKGKIRILVAEDEPNYLRLMKLNLEGRGYEVVTAHNGELAIDLVATTAPDLILLDVRMPRVDGYEACQRIREFSIAPIIMVTGLCEEADKIKGLDLGADDYLTKPFGVNELLARVRSALRRSGMVDTTPPPEAFHAGALCINFAQQRVFVGEQEIELTATEYRLLCELARHAGKVLTPPYLLQKIWGNGREADTQLVWQAIHRLRHKLEQSPGTPWIVNKPGMGYVLVSPEALAGGNEE